jgi:hypothetical protein
MANSALANSKARLPTIGNRSPSDMFQRKLSIELVVLKLSNYFQSAAVPAGTLSIALPCPMLQRCGNRAIMINYTFTTHKGVNVSVDYLTPEETNAYKTSIASKIKDYGGAINVYELENGKVLADIFFGGSSLLYPSKEVYEKYECKIIFLRLPDSQQLVGFELLDADELSQVETNVFQLIGNSCEGETFLLSTGQVYTREEYRRHGYLFRSIEELNLYCTEWVNKYPLQVIVAVSNFR